MHTVDHVVAIRFGQTIVIGDGMAIFRNGMTAHRMTGRAYVEGTAFVAGRFQFSAHLVNHPFAGIAGQNGVAMHGRLAETAGIIQRAVCTIRYQ